MGANEQVSLSRKAMVIADVVEAICNCSIYLFCITRRYTMKSKCRHPFSKCDYYNGQSSSQGSRKKMKNYKNCPII